MKHILSVCLFISLSCFSVFAQTTVNGRVLDAETREGEAGAVVIIHRDGDNLAYSVTDTTGAFSLRTFDSGDMTLRIENMGRKTIEQSISATGGTIDLGEILIENDAETLKESSVQNLFHCVTVFQILAVRLLYL